MIKKYNGVIPLPYLAVIKERPRKPGFWSRIVQVFQRKPRSYRETILREQPIGYYTFSNGESTWNRYLLSDDMVAHNKECW
jgi:hypothetical protein